MMSDVTQAANDRQVGSADSFHEMNVEVFETE